MNNLWLAQAERLTLALNHLRSALSLLDEVHAPAHIGAHVDLAIHQLRSLANACSEVNENAVNQIATNADPQ